MISGRYQADIGPTFKLLVDKRRNPDDIGLGPIYMFLSFVLFWRMAIKITLTLTYETSSVTETCQYENNLGQHILSTLISQRFDIGPASASRGQYTDIQPISPRYNGHVCWVCDYVWLWMVVCDCVWLCVIVRVCVIMCDCVRLLSVYMSLFVFDDI